MTLELNPWNVEDLDDFLYFCCPECDLKDQSKVQFLQHALDQHPNAKECVQQFNEFIIKEEPNELNDDEEEDAEISENWVNTIKSEPKDTFLCNNSYDQNENVQDIIQNVQVKIESSDIQIFRSFII